LGALENGASEPQRSFHRVITIENHLYTVRIDGITVVTDAGHKLPLPGRGQPRVGEHKVKRLEPVFREQFAYLSELRKEAGIGRVDAHGVRSEICKED
jgi:hypothetical protein